MSRYFILAITTGLLLLIGLLWWLLAFFHTVHAPARGIAAVRTFSAPIALLRPDKGESHVHRSKSRQSSPDGRNKTDYATRLI
jgi:hypothetical protein